VKREIGMLSHRCVYRVLLVHAREEMLLFLNEGRKTKCVVELLCILNDNSEEYLCENAAHSLCG
jgi:hypothetical protein